MHIRTSIKDQTAVMHIAGRFGINGFSYFRETCDMQLLLHGVTSLEIDISGVVSFNSSALGMLLLARERAKTSGKELQLSNLNENMLHVFRTANFHRLFTIV